MAKSKKLERKADQIAEIKKCGIDPIYFIKTYVKISHPTKGPIAFETYPFQEDCVRDFLNHKRIICNKSRQLGLSTVSAAYSLWLALFRRNKNIIILATRLDTAKLFLEKVKGMFESLPEWLVMPELLTLSVKEMKFSNKSIIKALPCTTNAARGEAISLLIVDEAAHIDEFDQVWMGLSPTLSCVSGDTLVLTEEGFQKIEDLHSGRQVGDYFEMNIPIFGKDGMEPISHGYVSPENETYIITTKRGFQVETTPIHPLYVLQKEGVGKMIQAQDLHLGESLRIQIGMNKFGKQEMSPDMAYMLGGFTAEGWVNKTKTKNGIKHYSINVENSDPDFRNVFLNSKDTKPFVITKRETRISCNSVESVKKFIDYGINPNHRCFQKEVPNSVLKGTREIVTNYLSGLFDGDGCASTRGICLNSTSHVLIRQTQQLLANLGFVTNIIDIIADQSQIGVYMLPQDKTIQSVRNSWQLTIPLSQTLKFITDIGFRIARKQACGLAISKTTEQDSFKHYTSPKKCLIQWFQEIITGTKKTSNWYRSQGVRLDKALDARSDRKITQQLMNDFISVAKSTGYNLTETQEQVFLENTGNFTWDEIVSIKKSFNKTYDFTVPKTHTFLQNCILGSNTGGDVILISSPNGVGNQFYNIWQKATDNKEGVEGSNGFYGLFLPYHVHPEHDQKWFDEQCASLQGSPRAIAQELLASFEASGHSFLDSDTLNKIAGRIESPLARFGPNLDMVVWKYAVEGHKYILSADVARGDADDFSAFHVIDATQEEIVAEYRGRMQPDRFAEFMIEVALKYNEAFIVHEMNASGLTTSYKLKELKYKHLYYEKLFTNDLFKVFTQMEIGELIPGFTTSVKTRPIMLSKLEATLRNNRIKCKSERLVSEFRTFVVTNDKPQAQKNCHDDLVISLAIGVNFMEYVWNNTPKEENYAWAMLAGMSRTSSTLAELQRKHQTSQGGWGISGNDMPSRSGWTTTEKITNKDENADFHRSFDWLLRP